MFNLLNTHRETRNPIWDTVLIIAATIIVSALIFSITAVASMTSPQPDHVSMVIAAHEQADLLHNTSLALLTLGLAALPLVICSLVIGQSGNTTSSTEQR